MRGAIELERTAQGVRLRAFAPAVHGFLDTIREGHPTTPLLVVSSVLCPIHEETPGPAAADVGDIADQIHPDAVTHRLIGERFAEHAFAHGGPLA